MDEKEKKVLNHSFVRLVKELDPQELLPYLPCLTQSSKEEIEAEQRNRGRSRAVNIFYEHLIRRPTGFKQLIDALRDPGIDCSDLADSLTASLEDLTAGRKHSPSSKDIRGRRGVPNGASNWTSELPNSSGQQGRSARATEPLTIDTQWRKLPGKIQTVLRKFDIGDALKKPADLAGWFDFTVEEIDELKTRTSQEESLTLAIITCKAQREPVTLGSLFRAFYDLDRIDIVNELQETTGVRFERPPERRIFGGTDGNQQVDSESLPDRIDDVNMNFSTEKPIVFKKSVTNGKEFEVRRQTAEKLSQNCVHANQDSKHNILEPQDNGKWNVKDDEISLKEASRSGQGQKGWFIGYKPEEILNNTADTRTSPLSILKEKPQKKEERRELSSRLPSAQLFNDVLETRQVEGDETFVIHENNLGRSDSSCSSDTDNNYSLDCRPDYLNAGDSDKLEIDNSPMVGTSGEKINMCEGNIGECNGNALNHECKQLGSLLEVNANPVNSENNFQPTGSIQTTNGFSEKCLDENSVKAEFDMRLLEERLKDDNFSNISSLYLSVKGSLSSTKSPHNGPKQEKGERTFMSVENYVDNSLEDNKIDIPKLSICSRDMQSIERKAGKKIPGDERLFEGNKNDISYSYQENSGGSFQFDWDISEGGEALSTDGEQELQGQEIRESGLKKQSYGQFFGQSQDVESGNVRMKDQEPVEDATILGYRNDELDVKESKDVIQDDNSNVNSADFERYDMYEKSELKCIGIENAHMMLEGKESNDNKHRSRHELFKDGKFESSDVERLVHKDSERVSEGTGHVQHYIEEVSNENRPTVITQRETNSNENELQAVTNQRLSSVKDLLKTCLTVIKIVYENSV